MFVILSGSSGAGKNTVIDLLIKKNPDYLLLPTYTTREMRSNETQGKPYFFIGKDEFLKALEEGDLFEHQIVHGNYYGVSKSIFKKVYRDNCIFMKDIDVMGTLSLLDSREMPMDILAFFLTTDSKDELIRRLEDRGEKNIELRLRRYDFEQGMKHRYDYIINNVRLEATAARVDAVIRYHLAHRHPYPTKPAAAIDRQRVEEIARSLREGLEPEPVTVAVREGRVSIVRGHHRYLAAVLAGKKIAKLVADETYISLVESENGKWFSYIDDLSSLN